MKNTTQEKTNIKKFTASVFGKKIYLLGADENGMRYYLEAPSWDCDWYWGFGYIETYTNNEKPQLSRDIISHQHFDTLFLNGRGCAYELFSKFFSITVLTDDEIWLLCDYMKTFYTLKAAAEVFRHGYSWQTERAKLDKIQDKNIEEKINKIMLPEIFDKIDKLLSE